MIEPYCTHEPKLNPYILVSLSGKEASFFYFLYTDSSFFFLVIEYIANYKDRKKKARREIEKRKSPFVIVEFDLNKYTQSVSLKSVSGTRPFFPRVVHTFFLLVSKCFYEFYFSFSLSSLSFHYVV